MFWSAEVPPPVGGRVDPADFEQRDRRAEDPWSFATSPYELDKYADTVRAIGAQRVPSALELGCSIGVLTRLLAARCDDVLAVDGSRTAVAAATRRTADLPHVRVASALLPEELPTGRWELIVASEILYYFDPPLLDGLLDGLEARLTGDGVLLAVHYTGEAPDHRLTGDEVHDRLLNRPALAVTHDRHCPGYRLTRLGRR